MAPYTLSSRPADIAANVARLQPNVSRTWRCQLAGCLAREEPLNRLSALPPLSFRRRRSSGLSIGFHTSHHPLAVSDHLSRVTSAAIAFVGTKVTPRRIAATKAARGQSDRGGNTEILALRASEESPLFGATLGRNSIAAWIAVPVGPRSLLSWQVPHVVGQHTAWTANNRLIIPSGQQALEGANLQRFLEAMTGSSALSIR